MMHQDLSKVGTASSFVSKHIHVKPKEFGDRIKAIRSGKVLETKVVRKDERIRIMREEKVRQNEQKVLTHHQNVNSASNQNQAIPINKPNAQQIIPSPPNVSNIQISKPQIIQIQQPTLNHLVHRVPVIPQHLRQPTTPSPPQNIAQQP